MPRIITTKTILSGLKKPDPWFGISYNMNLYRGCQHQCIYCDSRSLVYQLGDLADIRIKENALRILERELKSKRKRGTVGFGSMNDPYMPLEENQELTRGALKLLIKYHYPAHIITKSTMVLRDIDLLKELSKNYVAVSVSITTIKDQLSALLEPGSPSSSQRLYTIRQLSESGIYCGVTFMPQLPFINDSWEETKELILAAKEAGASYILYAPGLTLREGSREYFYNKLDKHFPGLKEKYENTFGNNYNCSSPNASELYPKAKDLCGRINLAMKMEHHNFKRPDQLSLFG